MWETQIFLECLYPNELLTEQNKTSEEHNMKCLVLSDLTIYSIYITPFLLKKMKPRQVLEVIRL